MRNARFNHITENEYENLCIDTFKGFSKNPQTGRERDLVHMKVEDKSAVINVIEENADNNIVYEIKDVEWYGNYLVLVI